MTDNFFQPPASSADNTTGPWEFRAVWPVEDSDLGSQQAFAQASEDLPNLLADNARLLAVPSWTIEEVPDPAQSWPHTDYVVIAVAPAVPAHPTREQWPSIIDRLGAGGWTDRDIAVFFEIPISLVEVLHRGVPGPRHLAAAPIAA